MDTTILSDSLNAFLGIAQANYHALWQWAIRLFFLLVVLDIVVAVILPLVRGQNFAPNLIKRLTVILVLFVFITNYDFWTNLVVNGGISAGVRGATGQPIGGPQSTQILNVLRQPSEILTAPAQLLGAMFSNFSITNIGSSLLNVLLGLIMFLSFVIVALTVVVTYLEFAFAVTLALILFPFTAFKPTSFIGERVFGLVISYAVRLMVLAFIVGVGHQIIGTANFQAPGSLHARIFPANYTDWTQGMVAAMIGILYLMLAMSIPKMAAGLFSGSPSLSGGDAALAGGAAALTAVGAAGGAVAAGKLGLAGAAKTLSAANAVGGFTKGAYSAGWAAAGSGLGPAGGPKAVAAGLRGVATATGNAASGAARSGVARVTAPVQQRFEGARYAGTLAAKAPSGFSLSGGPSRGRPLSPGEQFSAQQASPTSQARLRDAMRNPARNMGRGAFGATALSQSPIAGDPSKPIKDDDA
ncbi:MAG: type IV secretion system protein [Pseudomonadota bacterium]